MIYPKLSIIIPTYNRAKLLSECLESVILQDYPSLEIVITDDHSTDKTQDVCNNYVEKYPFIRHVVNDNYPQGPNGNKNNGFDYVTGELIGILDDDDTLNKGALFEMVNKLLEGYDVVMANCQIISLGKNNGLFSGFGLNQSQNVNYKKYFCGEISGEYWSIFRRELLGIRRFDTDLYGGEGILWKEIFKNAKMYYLHKAVRNYRISNLGITHNMTKYASKAIKNYEKDIAFYGAEMKKECPCYLAQIYNGAVYFARMASQYKKAFRYMLISFSLCFRKDSFKVLLVLFLPKGIIKWLSQIKQTLKDKR